MRSPENIRKAEAVEEARRLLRPPMSAAQLLQYLAAESYPMIGAREIAILGSAMYPGGPSKLGAPAKKDRDARIVRVVKVMCERYGVKPTRGEVARINDSNPSACSIVAEALGLKDRAVEAVWRKRPNPK
jgi:hypothetical protein